MAIQVRWAVHPLNYCGLCRLHKQRMPADEVQVFDSAIDRDGSRESNLTVDTGAFGERRVNWLHFVDQAGSFDIASHTDLCRGG